MKLILPGAVVYAPRSTTSNDRAHTSCGIVTRVHVTHQQAGSLTDLYSTVDSLNASEIATLNSLIVVWVYDGTQSWAIPISCCTLCGVFIGEDKALEILRTFKNSTTDAFKYILSIYNSSLEHPDEFLWAKEQFDAFMNAVQACKRENLWRVYLMYKKNMRRVVLRKKLVEKSFKSIYDLYERMFPDIDKTILRDSGCSEEFLASQSTNRLSPGKLQLHRINIGTDMFRGPDPAVKVNTLDADADMKSERHIGESNRWPSSLSMVRNNLFWYRPTESPCICLGLDPASLRNYATEPLVRVYPINTTMYLHEIKVPSITLEPLTFQTLNTRCQDQRSIHFTRALMMFSEWELQNNPKCLWYIYPKFILDFLRHPPTWSSWRTRAERAARGSKDEKHEIYFRALKDELRVSSDNRCENVDYPWDDEAIAVRN